MLSSLSSQGWWRQAEGCCRFSATSGVGLRVFRSLPFPSSSFHDSLIRLFSSTAAQQSFEEPDTAIVVPGKYIYIYIYAELVKSLGLFADLAKQGLRTCGLQGIGTT